MSEDMKPTYAGRARKYNDNSRFGQTMQPGPGDMAEQIEDTGAPETFAEPPSEEYTDTAGRYRNRSGGNTRVKRKKNQKSSALGWVISIAAAVCIAIFVRLFVFEIILVDGQSMQPTLYTNERVAVEKVSRYFGLPKRGDVVIVHYPDIDGTFVKRTIALPGETVEIKDSTVYIDGQPLSEEYINHEEPYGDMAATVVPEGHVFVMGDNRAHSLDSRTYYIGPISKDQIVGHGMFVIWPFNQIRGID
ncbi:MAG: signal peptidase I [Christensenellaceae bacterium]